MMALNHGLTGMIIGVATGNPVLAAPIAFASHFVSDAMPHWGDKKYEQKEHKREWYLNAVSDLLFTIALWITLSMFFPGHMLLMFVGATFAILPDGFWASREFLGWAGPKKLAIFHKWIQWGERPWGLYLEMGYIAIQLFILTKLLSN